MKLRVLVLSALLALVTIAQPMNASEPCTAPPTTEISRLGFPLDATWYRDWVFVAFFASSECGVQETRYRLDGGAAQNPSFPLIVETSGLHTIEAWSIDTAGSVGPSAFAAFGIDQRPEITNNVAGPVGQNGWFVGPVTVTFTATDDFDTPRTEYVVGSGVTQAYEGPFVVSTDGNQTVTGYADDRWWFGSGRNSFDLRIDTVVPTAALLRPSEGTLYVADQAVQAPGAIQQTTVVGTVTLEADAADATSGIQFVRFLVDDTALCVVNVAPYTCEWDSTTVAAGEHTLAVEAVDFAGHVGLDARAVQVIGL